jgi:hypothetical protein
MRGPRKYSFGQILDIFWPYILPIAVVVALISFWLFASRTNISPLRLTGINALQILPPDPKLRGGKYKAHQPE